MGFFSKAKHFAKGRKNRLTGLRLTSVDFCRQGANPEADIKLRKSLFPEDGGQIFQDEQLQRSLNERLWSLQDALVSSFRSIISEPSAQRESLLLESLEEFREEAARFIGELCRTGQETQSVTLAEAQKTQKGACQTMNINELNIDVSALTAEEQAQLEALVGKAVPAADPPNGDPPKAEPPKPEPPASQPEEDPAVAKAVEAYTGMAKRLEAQVQRLEAQELDQVAKKYEVLGDETLRETLGVMKAAGETAYTGYLAALDRQMALMEKADGLLLGEIGKSSHGEAGGTAVEKALAAAAALRKADPSLSQQEAMVRVFETDPALASEYESEYAERR